MTTGSEPASKPAHAACACALGRKGDHRPGWAALLAAMLVLASSAAVGAAPFAYVANSGNGTLSVIDTATMAVDTTLAVGPFPTGVAVSPGGSRVYVTNAVIDGTVTVIDTELMTPVAVVPVGQRPAGVAVKLPGNVVYAVNREDGTVSVIDTATNTVTATVSVGRFPQGVAVNPVGTPVYVANQNSDTVSVIDTNSNTVTATVPVGHNPTHVAVNPAGTRVYVANNSYGLVSVIDTATNVVTATIRAGNYPSGVAVDPSGTRAYVANRGPNTVSVIDTVGNTVVANVPVGLNPSGLAVTPAGKHVYVTNQSDGTVSVIDTAGGNFVAATVAVGLGPVGMGEFIIPALAPPVFGKAALACQTAIAISAKKFALAGSASQARCRNRVLKDAADEKDTTAAAAACAQALDFGDPKSALALLRTRAREKITKKCAQLSPAALHSPCDRAARTFAETADCVLEQHQAKLADMIVSEYGPDPVRPLEESDLKCQGAIVVGARKLAKFVHTGLTTCLNRMLKDVARGKGTLSAAARCSKVLDPENPGSKLARVRAKTEAKIADKCGAIQAARIDSRCGGAVTTAGELATCVLDEHVAQVAKMVAAEYNSACPMLTGIGLGSAFPTVCTGP